MKGFCSSRLTCRYISPSTNISLFSFANLTGYTTFEPVYPEPGPIGECDGRTPADRYDQLVKFLCLCRIAFWTEVHLFGVDIYLSFLFIFELGFRPVNGQLLVVGKDQLHFFICTVWCRIGLDDCQIVCFGIFRPQGGIPADC